MHHLPIARLCALIVPVLCGACPALAQDCCDPAGPFALGEDYPKVPATCATIEHWAARAPDTDARISLAITGKLSGVRSDGALAYLEMCGEAGFKVSCITYSTNGMRTGDTVMLAGGFNRAGDKHAVLDPCLASREPQ